MGYMLSKGKLLPYLNALSRKMQVIVPQMNNCDASVFDELTPETELALSSNTDFSPQKWLQPAHETLFRFERKPKGLKISEVLDKQQRVVFGVRSCDLHAIGLLDRLFLEFYGADHYYRRRRHHTLIIALACGNSCKSGFCTSLGTSKPVNHDLLFIDKGKNYFVEAASQNAKQLILHKFMRPCPSTPVPPTPKCRKKLNTKNISRNLNRAWKHAVWKREAKRCLSCSSCTMVCPACYCFLVDDVFNADGSSERYREWDSCQLLRFSAVAGNHVFRKSRSSRLRQWLFHKFLYFPEHHGAFGCTGCGRCIEICPVGIDLTVMLNDIQKKKRKAVKP